MRKYKYEGEKIVGKTLICNKCGKVKIYNAADLAIYLDYGNKMNNIKINFSYGDSFDGQEWQFDLCEDCLLELIKSFKYIPKGFRFNKDDFIELSDEQYQGLFDNWKTTGEWEELSAISYDELMELVEFVGKERINDVLVKYHPYKMLIE